MISELSIYISVSYISEPEIRNSYSCCFLGQGLFGPKFLDHCFVVITNGKNLYMKTNLATYLEEERDSDFGKLLNDTVKRRVIVVENSEETMYGRREQRLQVIRMIAANMHGTFTNDAIMEVLSSWRYANNMVLLYSL